MIALIITAIGTVLFVMYALGIACDGAVLIASAILIVGGLIKVELGLLVDMLMGVGIFSEDDFDDDKYN